MPTSQEMRSCASDVGDFRVFAYAAEGEVAGGGGAGEVIADADEVVIGGDEDEGSVGVSAMACKSWYDCRSEICKACFGICCERG